MADWDDRGKKSDLPPELLDGTRTSPEVAGSADPREITRTDPDYVLYDPTGGSPREWSDPDFFWLNEQILVVPLADGSLLATWTSERLDPHLLRIMYCKSFDGGTSWSTARFIDGDGLNGSGPAAWQVPVVTESGSIYLFYVHSPIQGAGAFGGNLRCRVSRDHGESWSLPVDLEFPRGRFDSADSSVPPIWVSISVPIRDAANRPLLSYTRWASTVDVPGGLDVGIKQRHSHIEILRMENIDDDPEPADIAITPLLLDRPVTAPHEDIDGASFAQEPYIVRLPDDRLFMVLRTNRGEVWYTVSDADGQSWRMAVPMRYHDGGSILKQCVSPCPVYQLDDHHFAFLFNNNDGFVFGAESRWDVRNRRPAYLCRGVFDPDARQPISWSDPALLIDNDAVPWGPPELSRFEAAAYPSLTIDEDGAILWYPDRKGFLLGKRLLLK